MIEMIERHAELLEHRLRKNYRHLRKRMARQHIEAYRLYDWDIPEVRARVDYYAGHLVVAEYEREQTKALENYLPELGQAAARAIEIPAQSVHLKSRRTRPREGVRYEKLDDSGKRLVVRERELRFWVNLDDYLDTGLFADHRETRHWLGGQAAGLSCLNLYCYTGAFTCAFALGGARAVTSVDLSGRYLDWTRDNLRLNGVSLSAHEFVEGDVMDFLNDAASRRWDLIFVDPPSFSTVGGQRAGGGTGFDVQRDHEELVTRARACLTPSGRLVFSTNHQRFEPRFPESFRASEITHRTVPEDFRNRQVHRCFEFGSDPDGGSV